MEVLFQEMQYIEDKNDKLDVELDMLKQEKVISNKKIHDLEQNCQKLQQEKDVIVNAQVISFTPVSLAFHSLILIKH